MAELTEGITAALVSDNLSTLRQAVQQLMPEDLADALNNTPDANLRVIFRLLSRERAIRTFEYLNHDLQYRLLSSLPVQRISYFLNLISPDDRTALFEQLPQEVMRSWLGLLNEEERRKAQALLQYPEESIGRLMTPNFVSVQADWTVREALDYIRTYGRESETLNLIFVTNRIGVLQDDIAIREFLLAEPDAKVSELMDGQFTSLDAKADREAAVDIFRRSDRLALPVTDFDGILIGLVTVDDVMDVIESENTEDMLKMGGSETFEQEYLRIPLVEMVKKRAGWLIVLFISEMLTATAMTYFEDEIAKAVVLALFVPLIISSGGNSGSQAATLIIRSLALGEVRISDWVKVLRRELLSGLSLGLILGFIGFLRIVIWSTFSDVYGEHWLKIAFTVGFSLIGVVLWGSLSGSLLPMLLKKLGFDPATSSAPFVATLVDVTGIVIYFSVAYAFLQGSLL